ncbi:MULTISPECIES: hypothetical protein [Burkholderiaceae]|nr:MULTISPECIES: hypothetical protein [Burkholderiaceae]MCF2135428.1 hypothetical protein [Mycetohabitans sp. B3]MCG1019668.1 hypothetical protein [Mycetohabitans sp. B4]
MPFFQIERRGKMGQRAKFIFVAVLTVLALIGALGKMGRAVGQGLLRA